MLINGQMFKSFNFATDGFVLGANTEGQIKKFTNIIANWSWKGGGTQGCNK